MTTMAIREAEGIADALRRRRRSGSGYAVSSAFVASNPTPFVAGNATGLDRNQSVDRVNRSASVQRQAQTTTAGDLSPERGAIHLPVHASPERSTAIGTLVTSVIAVVTARGAMECGRTTAAVAETIWRLQPMRGAL